MHHESVKEQLGAQLERWVAYNQDTQVAPARMIRLVRQALWEQGYIGGDV